MLQAGNGVDVLEVRDTHRRPVRQQRLALRHDRRHREVGGLRRPHRAGAEVQPSTATARPTSSPTASTGSASSTAPTSSTRPASPARRRRWDELLEQAAKIQDPSKNRYGYAFRGGKNGNGNVVAAIEAYVGGRHRPRERLQDPRTARRSSPRPRRQAAVDTYFDLFKQASPPSSVAWGYPEMVEGFNNGSTAFLLQDPEVIATIYASKAVKTDQWNTAPLLTGPGGQGRRSPWPPPAGASPRRARTRRRPSSWSSSSPARPSTTFAKENSLVPIQKSRRRRLLLHQRPVGVLRDDDREPGHLPHRSCSRAAWPGGPSGQQGRRRRAAGAHRPAVHGRAARRAGTRTGPRSGRAERS